MGSDFHALFAEAAMPLLIEQFGERDEDNFLAEFIYRTGIVEDVERVWNGILSPIKFEDVFDAEKGDLTRKETRTLRVARSTVDDDEIFGFQRDGTFEINEEIWALNEAATEWGSGFVTFGLIREPLSRKYEARAAV